jgi:hypothetical protein
VRPSPFALLVVVLGLLSTPTTAIRWQVVLCVFAATAAVELTALGGAPLTPSVTFLGFLIFHALRVTTPGAFREVHPATFWLFACVLWGLIGALLWPRLWAGEVLVYGVDRLSGDLAVKEMSLRPGSGNITQTAYVLGSTMGFVCMRRLISRDAIDFFGRAVLLLGAVDCGAALLNLAEFYLHLPPMLVYVRTANYAMFGAYEEAGLMRIQGTFAETSAFASFSLPLFAFAMTLWVRQYESRYAGAVAGILLTLLLLSTSGTAYVGMSMYMSTFLVRMFWKGLTRGQIPQWRVFCLLGLGGVAWLLAIFVFETKLAGGIEHLVDRAVFGKLASKSGIERAAWNSSAWSAFVETYGLGVGLGSTRASSWLMSLLASLGVMGVLLFGRFLFVLYSLRPRRGEALHPVVIAAREAMLCSLLTSSVSGSSFDLGIIFYSMAAAASLARSTSLPKHDPEGDKEEEQDPEWVRDEDVATDDVPTPHLTR